MGKPATGSMDWPGSTVYKSIVRDSRGQELASVEASEQPDDPIIFNKEGQRQSYATFEKSERCWSCGIEFPRSKMTQFKGRWYGIPCGDYKDIAQLKSRNKK